MKPVTRDQIANFLEPRKFAIAGVSRNPKKFSHQVFLDLKKSGYEVLAVNPGATEIDGEHCYASVSELPSDIRHLLIITPRAETNQVLREAIKKGMNSIWVQQMSETEETIQIAEEFHTELIYRKCIYMFAEPVSGVHRFHKGIMKFFGRLPK